MTAEHEEIGRAHQLLHGVVLYTSEQMHSSTQARIALDARLYVTEQWGDTNCNLSGLSISFFDPIAGIGGSYYRAIPDALNIVVGGQILMSVPTALVRGISGQSTDVVDPLLTAAFVVRVPLGGSSYAINGIVSTNGNFGVGISLMNTSLLPFLP